MDGAPVHRLGGLVDGRYSIAASCHSRQPHRRIHGELLWKSTDDRAGPASPAHHARHGYFLSLGLSAADFRAGREACWPAWCALVVTCAAMAALRAWAEPLHIEPANWPSAAWTANWYGPGELGTLRAHILAGLKRQPGKQLAIVRYSPDRFHTHPCRSAENWRLRNERYHRRISSLTESRIIG